MGKMPVPRPDGGIEVTSWMELARGEESAKMTSLCTLPPLENLSARSSSSLFW